MSMIATSGDGDWGLSQISHLAISMITTPVFSIVGYPGVGVASSVPAGCTTVTATSVYEC